MRIHRLALALLVVYVVVLAVLTLRPVGADADSQLLINLKPWATIGTALRLGPGSASFRALIGNLLAFVPLGLLLPAASRLRWPLVILAGLCLSALIEATQYGLSLYVGHHYRSADIDDVIVNTCGTVIGLALFGVVIAAQKLVRRLRGVDAVPQVD